MLWRVSATEFNQRHYKWILMIAWAGKISSVWRRHLHNSSNWSTCMSASSHSTLSYFCSVGVSFITCCPSLISPKSSLKTPNDTLHKWSWAVTEWEVFLYVPTKWIVDKKCVHELVCVCCCNWSIETMCVCGSCPNSLFQDLALSVIWRG